MIPELLRKARLVIGWWVLPAPKYRVESRLDVLETELRNVPRETNDPHLRDRLHNQTAMLVRELGLETGDAPDYWSNGRK